MSEYVDGRRWPAPETSGEVPADRRDLPTVSTSEDGSLPDFPSFDVHPGYVMHADSVALHFHPDTIPALCVLFPAQADNLRAAALDVEMEAERQQQETADRALLRGLR